MFIPTIPPIAEPRITAIKLVKSWLLKAKDAFIITPKIYVITKYIRPVASPLNSPYIGTFLEVRNPAK